MPSQRTPETLTAAQRAQRLNIKPSTKKDETESDTMTKKPPPPTSKQMQKVMDQGRRTLPSISGARTSATANIDPMRDADMSFSILPIAEIEAYEHNPRQSINSKYEEIKESIRADGITNTLTVTRRNIGSKYTTYGGGGTRLQAAKELYAEGDQRFAALKVIIKEWPGDAQVIAAHLVENELRSDISFWEKACGVHKFRLELEREHSKSSTAGELNRELKTRGLNYGVKTIQNFVFATDHLAPVGPWLKSRDVNDSIRPKVAALLELGIKLGAGDQLHSQLQQVMEAHAATLRQCTEQNNDLEPSERTPVELDVAGLLMELEAATAQHLGLPAVQLPAMLAALATDPRVTPEMLRAATPSMASVTKVPAQQARHTNARQDTAQQTQTPLAGMLAVVPSPRLPAMPAQAPAQPGQDALAELLETIRQHLGALNAAVPLHDVLCALASMPFGYLVDLPRHGIAHADAKPVRADLVPLRSALWKLLAALSYQYDKRIVDQIPATSAHETLWTSTLLQGQKQFEQACADKAGLHITGDCYQIGMGDLALVLGSGAVGYSFIKLLTTMEQVRLNFPDRIPDGFQPPFA